MRSLVRAEPSSSEVNHGLSWMDYNLNPDRRPKKEWKL